MALVNKYSVTKDDETPKQCPYCFVSSWDEGGFDAYEECILKADFEHNIVDCKEGQDACITDYLHYEDSLKESDKTINFCEVGGDCCKFFLSRQNRCL